MFGIISAIIAGVAMSLQGVFNTRLGDSVGIWETNTFVQGSAFIVTIIITFFLGKGSYKELLSANKLYLTSGLISVLIIFTVMSSIKSKGPAQATAIILVSQLLGAALIDAFALFDTEKIPFTINKIIGVVVMIVGIIIFKWNK